MSEPYDPHDDHGPRPGPSPEVLGQLVGQFAHDLNNMLGTVLTGLELAATADTLEQSRSFLATALRMARVQRDYTAAMARLSGACENESPTGLHALIAECRPTLEQLGGPAVDLELALEATADRVCCDRGFLRTALWNLTMHAAAAMPDGGRLRLATGNAPPPGAAPAGDRGQIYLTATDTGRGLSEMARLKAFDVFSSVEGGAAGIGLAQVRDTVRRAGGWASIDSAPGGGTRIVLTLPLA